MTVKKNEIDFKRKETYFWQITRNKKIRILLSKQNTKKKTTKS